MKFTKRAQSLIDHAVQYGESGPVEISQGLLSYLRKLVSNYNAYNQVKVSVKKITGESVILVVNKARTAHESNPFTVVNLRGLEHLKNVLTGKFERLDMDGLMGDLEKIRNIAFINLADTEIQ